MVMAMVLVEGCLLNHVEIVFMLDVGWGSGETLESILRITCVEKHLD